MKKQLLFFCFLLMARIGSAQIGAGTTLVGGNVSFFHQTSKSKDASFNHTVTHSGYSLNPNVGYFIAENLIIGIGLSVSKFTAKTEANPSYQSGTSSNQSFGFSPFGRYYKMLGERAGFFGQLTGSFLQGNIKTENTPTNKFNTISLGLAPGFVFFPSPKIGLETTVGYLGYHRRKYKSEATNQTNASESLVNGFSASVEASNVLLGINFYLGR